MKTFSRTNPLGAGCAFCRVGGKSEGYLFNGMRGLLVVMAWSGPGRIGEGDEYDSVSEIGRIRLWMGEAFVTVFGVEHVGMFSSLSSVELLTANMLRHYSSIRLTAFLTLNLELGTQNSCPKRPFRTTSN